MGMEDERPTEELVKAIRPAIDFYCSMSATVKRPPPKGSKGAAAYSALEELTRRLDEHESGEVFSGMAARFRKSEAELAEARGKLETLAQDYTRVMIERDEAREALREVQAIQPKRLEWLREHGIVFRNAPFFKRAPEGEAEKWEHVAFAIYTDLCEAETIARAAEGDET